jgi:hypothetical protein
MAIGGAGDDHGSAGTGVAGDGDRAVVGCECELGLHHSRQHHRTQQAELNQVLFDFHEISFWLFDETEGIPFEHSAVRLR